MISNQRMPGFFKMLLALTLAILFALPDFSAIGSFLLRRFENRTIDSRFLIRSAEAVDDRLPVVIVFIDNESALAHGYRSPTPRTLLADTINVLDAKGAKVIGVDVLLDRSYNEKEDAMLESAIVNSEAEIVLVDQINEAESEKKNEPVTSLLPRFAKVASRGFSISRNDGDDYHRWARIYPYKGLEDIAVAIYKSYTGKIDFLPERLAIDEQNPWVLLNFCGTPSRVYSENPHFMVFSASEVRDIPKIFFKDKIILIGSAIEDLGDIFLTPFSIRKNDYMPMFGVELQALRLKMFFQNAYLYPVKNSRQFGYLLFLFFIACTGFLFFRPVAALIWLPVCALTWSFISVYIFIKFQAIVLAAYPVATLLFLFIFCQWLIRITERKYASFLKSSFQRYISPVLVEQLAKSRLPLSLGGEKKNLTILFSDLKDFSSVAEQMDSEQLMQFLHIYFDEMTKVLFQEKGTLDKYIGDAIMGFFGAPTPLYAHAIHGCCAAINMQKAMDALNKDPGDKWVPTRVRIGINTADVIVGNCGSATRFNYTVIGDGVNLASRLEGANKMFGSKILVSEFTLKSMAENPAENLGASNFFTRELGRVVVKGKARPVAVFELFDFYESATDEQRVLKVKYENALKDFYEKNFDAAKQAFEKLAIDFKDQASIFMLKQIEFFKKQPPEDDWKGEIILLSK
ncbi:adenylate/guanylate cyclase domain-containing protein [Desulfobacterales bacterium HSG16]|nr:adenylate/guanylate cyclase domain-containing protein [Desulfobacterales bacterium HSG16]